MLVYTKKGWHLSCHVITGRIVKDLSLENVSPHFGLTITMDFTMDQCLLYFQREMRIDVNKHWPVYLDFGRAGSLSLQLY